MNTFKLVIPERELAVQLARAGSEHPKALAKIVTQFDIELVDALDLAMMHCQPQKVGELCQKGLKVEQVCVVYDVSEQYSQMGKKPESQFKPSLGKLADFAIWFLGVDFTEEELVEALETAIRIFPMHWTPSLDLNSEISYALGYGHALEDHSIESIEEKEIARSERATLPLWGNGEELEDLSSTEGQGDIP